MANDKSFKIKNGLSVGTRYLQTGGTETAGAEGYDLGSAEYDSVSFSPSEVSQPRCCTFKPDGTKLYIAGNNSDIFQYSLSTAWDLSTASYDSKTYNPSEDTDPKDVKFKTDGTKMYIVGDSTDVTYQYTLSTAWDISTASYDSKSFTSSEATGVRCIFFKNDGLTSFFMGANEVIYQYTLSTAWDISTMSYASKSLNVVDDDDAGSCFTFNADATKLFYLGSENDLVHQYTLSTAYDISTASKDSVTFSVNAQATSPFGLAFKSDGTKMFTCSLFGGEVFQYSTASYTQTLDLSTGTYFSFTPSGATTVSFTNAPASGKAVGFAVEINGDGSAITWPSSVKWPSGVAPTATASKEVYAFVTTDGGTSYYGKLAGSDIA